MSCEVVASCSRALVAAALVCAMLAGCSGKDAAVDELAKRNIPVSADSLAGSAAEGNVQVVKLLLKAGVTVDAKDSRGSTPLIEASWAGKTDVVNLLIEEKANVNEVTPKPFSALLAAIFQKHDDAALKLLEKGANPNVVDSNGVSPLMEVAWHGNVNLIKALIAKGVDVNYVRQSDGATALKAATANNQPEAVKLLQEAGAKN